MSTQKRYTVLLFQKYIRGFVVNFNHGLRRCEMVLAHPQESTTELYKRLTNYADEIERKKLTWKRHLRRIVGIPNIRIKFTFRGDLLFTYGAFVLTNKPYCIYAETGLAVYGYDRKTADNPIARFLASWFLRRKNCKKIIFLSHVAKKSFLTSAHYSKKTQEVFEKKAAVCYPLIKAATQKKHAPAKELRLLFLGTFYIKGGREVVNAFNRLRKVYPHVTLTIITTLSILHPRDLAELKKTPGITLHDAKFSQEEIYKFFAESDIFVMPTYRDGFGLVWIEALAHGLPIVGTDQYATSEMCTDGYNGFLLKNHPLLEYNPETYEIYGTYYDPKEFYEALFAMQKAGKLKKVEDFLFSSIEKFCREPSLVEEFSKNSRAHYDKNFHEELVARRMDSLLVRAIER